MGWGGLYKTILLICSGEPKGGLEVSSWQPPSAWKCLEVSSRQPPRAFRCLEETSTGLKAPGDPLEETSTGLKAPGDPLEETSTGLKAPGDPLEETSTRLKAPGDPLEETSMGLKALGGSLRRIFFGSPEVQALSVRMRSATSSMSHLGVEVAPQTPTLWTSGGRGSVISAASEMNTERGLANRHWS